MSARAAVARPTIGQRAGASLRRRLTTTPGRMRLAIAAIVVGLLLVALVGTVTYRARQRATNEVGQQAEPLLVGAEVMYSSLADADATATNTFLQAGLEPPARRQAYLNDLATAANQLASVSRQAGSNQEAAAALNVINADLPTYSGLVETARADNRLGLPIGAAYLSDSSTLMQTKILPAVKQVYQVEAERLDNAYGSGDSALDVAGVVVVGALALGVLILSQLFVTRRTNRVFNPALVAATLVTLGLMLWTITAFAASASRLQAARHRGSDPVQLLSTTGILVSRQQSDESLNLVARGSTDQYQDDFDAVSAALAPRSGAPGLLAQVEKAAPATDFDGLYASYLKAHQVVLTADDNGQFTAAVAAATGTASGDELPAAAALSGAVGGAISQAQSAFTTKAAAARHDLSLLGYAVIGLAVIAAALAITGLEQRINEYR